MHSLWIRCSSLLTVTIMSLSVLMFLCFLSTAFVKHSASAKIGVGRAMVDHADDYTLNKGYHNDLGLVTINLSYSLGHLFNWNVKQLFLYLTAEYRTPDNKLSQVILWDRIIQRGSNAEFDYRKMTTKYYFWDDGHGLRGNDNVTLTLSWNVVPNIGWLTFDTAKGSHTFKFPDAYVDLKQK